MPDPTIETTFLEIPARGSDKRPLRSFYARPTGPGPFPGVVVIHEISGLNENIKDVTERFAQRGYAALAVDLFSTASRAVCMARIFYGMLVRPLKNGVVRDLQVVLDALGERSEVDPSRLGAIGFCMGGSYALQLACLSDGMCAASVFYGMNPRPLDKVAGACPVVGSYPENDFTARAARQLEPMLEKYSVDHDIKVYPEARHSFFNDQGPNHDAEASADAWDRTLAFFEIHLHAH